MCIFNYTHRIHLFVYVVAKHVCVATKKNHKMQIIFPLFFLRTTKTVFEIHLHSKTKLFPITENIKQENKIYEQIILLFYNIRKKNADNIQPSTSFVPHNNTLPSKHIDQHTLYAFGLNHFFNEYVTNQQHPSPYIIIYIICT